MEVEAEKTQHITEVRRDREVDTRSSKIAEHDALHPSVDGSVDACLSASCFKSFQKLQKVLGYRGKIRNNQIKMQYKNGCCLELKNGHSSGHGLSQKFSMA